MPQAGYASRSYGPGSGGSRRSIESLQEQALRQQIGAEEEGASEKFWRRFDPALYARRDAETARTMGAAETEMAAEREKAILETREQAKLTPAAEYNRRQALEDEIRSYYERYVRPAEERGKGQVGAAEARVGGEQVRGEYRLSEAAIRALATYISNQAFTNQPVDPNILGQILEQARGPQR